MLINFSIYADLPLTFRAYLLIE